MLAIMNLVVSDNRTTVCPDLDSCQGIAVDVVSFNKASAIPKNINTTLVAIKNGIAPIFKTNKQKKPHILGHATTVPEPLSNLIHMMLSIQYLTFDSQATLTVLWGHC